MSLIPGSEPLTIRRTSYYSGTVQGVGFRATAANVASRFQVTGFVRNLRDGRVELVAEGSRAELGRFHYALTQVMQSYIESQTSADAAATGQFIAFEIAR